MNERTGACLCGAVKFRLKGEPLAARICWCRDCQHIAGNGTVNALFPSASIEVTSGELAQYTRTSDGGNRVDRRFCPKCGSHMFADSSGRSGFTVVRVGNLDDPSSIQPSANIWAGSAPAWACLNGELSRAERQPAPPPPPSTT